MTRLKLAILTPRLIALTAPRYRVLCHSLILGLAVSALAAVEQATTVANAKTANVAKPHFLAVTEALGESSDSRSGLMADHRFVCLQSGFAGGVEIEICHTMSLRGEAAAACSCGWKPAEHVPVIHIM